MDKRMALRGWVPVLLLAILVSCGGGKEKEAEKGKQSVTTTQKEKTYSYSWEAICRCPGSSGSGQGKLCQSKGTYSGEFENEDVAVEKMKEHVRAEMKCLEGPFLSFIYDRT